MTDYRVYFVERLLRATIEISVRVGNPAELPFLNPLTNLVPRHLPPYEVFLPPAEM